MTISNDSISNKTENKNIIKGLPGLRLDIEKLLNLNCKLQRIYYNYIPKDLRDKILTKQQLKEYLGYHPYYNISDLSFISSNKLTVSKLSQYDLIKLYVCTNCHEHLGSNMYMCYSNKIGNITKVGSSSYTTINYLHIKCFNLVLNWCNNYRARLLKYLLFYDILKQICGDVIEFCHEYISLF